MHTTNRRGFTLMELLLVIGIIAILAAIVIIAINPTKQLGDTKDVSRRASIREISNAISQYIIDGNSLAGLPPTKAAAVDICQTGVTGGACTGAGGYELEALSPTYLVSMPLDPNETGSTLTGFRVYRDGSFIQVCSQQLDVDCGS